MAATSRTPDWQTEDGSIRLYCADCLDVLPELEGVDAVVTDPVLPSCQIKQLPWIYTNFAPDWLICWYKGSPGHAAYIGFNDWEPMLVYGKRDGLQIHDYFYSRPEPFDNGHPCPKPLSWARWLVERVVTSGQVVCDPFMGSGTTGVACIRTGRKFIGIEKEPKYFDIAVKRITDELSRNRLFETPPKFIQKTLTGEVA